MNNRVTVKVGRGCSNFNINIVENNVFHIHNTVRPEQERKNECVFIKLLTLELMVNKKERK
jgi:hypothetical protein